MNNVNYCGHLLTVICSCKQGITRSKKLFAEQKNWKSRGTLLSQLRDGLDQVPKSQPWQQLSVSCCIEYPLIDYLLRQTYPEWSPGMTWEDVWIFVYNHQHYNWIPFVEVTHHNSPILQCGAPPAIDSGETKICTASWGNVDKHQMPRSTKLHLSFFQMS